VNNPELLGFKNAPLEVEAPGNAVAATLEERDIVRLLAKPWRLD
jgi:hypothetical protein